MDDRGAYSVYKLIVSDKATMEDYRKELEERTGIIIKYEED